MYGYPMFKTGRDLGSGLPQAALGLFQISLLHLVGPGFATSDLPWPVLAQLRLLHPGSPVLTMEDLSPGCKKDNPDTTPQPPTTSFAFLWHWHEQSQQLAVSDWPVVTLFTASSTLKGLSSLCDLKSGSL